MRVGLASAANSVLAAPTGPLRIRESQSRCNPLLNSLPLQGVLALVAMYPLIYAAARYNLDRFYPAFMIVVGADNISFID